MKNNNPESHHIKPAIISIAAFFFLLFATISYTHYKQGLWEKDIRSNLQDVLIGKKSKLEKALYSRIYYTRGVAAFVALKPDITTSEFYELAQEYIKNDTVISTMALSRNCVINAVYPYKGHEAAVGLDLLKHPERREIVEKTIETHQTFVAGPVELVEGGVAFISYTPIFDKASLNENLFWGVTDIVIKEQSLFNEAGFETSDNGFEYALRGYNGTGSDGAIFWGSPAVFEKKPVSIPIDLPIGSWILAGTPSGGWNQYPDQDKAITFILFVSSFIISILIWMFSRALLKIRQNEKELKAIFGSMDNLIVEFNTRGQYVTIAPTNDDILFLPRNELIGKTLHEIFDQEKADLLYHAISKCFETKKLVVVEYPLEIKEKVFWFSARISYKSADGVIFNAFDITEQKLNVERIYESEVRLKKLNEMKDKFFSIIAHDLRNPVASMKTITDLILEDYDTMDENQRIELLKSMELSSTNLYMLLEDLLQWSLSQSGNIVVKKQEIRLNDFCETLMQQLHAEAQLKNIEMINETDQKTVVWADSNLTGIVLRNLVSNAIKFTGKGGKIRICSEKIMQDQTRFQKISIVDNGIGIKAEKVESIFRIDQTTSTPGTENEKGTGLGLYLCKELIQKGILLKNSW